MFGRCKTSLNGIAGGALCLLLSSCSSLVRQQLKADIEYRRDVAIEVTPILSNGKELPNVSSERDNQENIGALVVPMARAYRIKGKAVADCDNLIWETCSQQHSIEVRDNSFDLYFVPEAEDFTCERGMEIKCLEEKRGRDNGAFLFFAGPEFKLPFKMRCNGEQFSGSTIACHAKAGLKEQKLSFDRDVIGFGREVKTLAPCGKFEGKEFKMDVPPNRCVWAFGDVKDKTMRARLYVLPYKDVTVNREAK